MASVMFDKAEDGSDSLHLTSIILHAADRLLKRHAGGDGGGKDQNILPLHHGLGVVAEDHLAVDILLRCRVFHRQTAKWL